VSTPKLESGSEWPALTGHSPVPAGKHWCPDALGFNLWYLLESDETLHGQGNMFLAKTPLLTPKMPPVRFEFHDGGASIVANEGGPHPKTFMTCEYMEDLELSFSYVDAKPGDCLIMSKRTLHMSDPRPHLRGRPVNRLAMNMRVLMRTRGHHTVSLDPRYPQNLVRQAYVPLMKKHLHPGLCYAFDGATQLESFVDREQAHHDAKNRTAGSGATCSCSCGTCIQVHVNRHALVDCND
jgi:hypothetical protein